MSKRRLMSLDELMERVQDALDCCALEVDVWELNFGSGGWLDRTAQSSDSLRRLTRCLRSHGVLDEYTTRKEA
jgi:hypothetical protein